MNWYAVRNIYHFGVKKSGANVFEERIVCIYAKDFEEAHKKGKEESEAYALENEFEAHNEQHAYKQDGKKLIDGYELWSELYESDLSLDEFYKEHYLKYMYAPDE
ncbi:DUF4288 domain-containing protein [Hahella sp. CR1]|uniref:DUF4288 domain-containing protein n=1 Tax=Hahella sp. CR1 TaxID=2992807 RepID=UPI0024423EC0|nr:DUF4288 domain-containing protein [Hahella sp. CR1]MDG9671417.1 DUF4288 domain-containing protein [Hahella sp. CR1]